MVFLFALFEVEEPSETIEKYFELIYGRDGKLAAYREKPEVVEREIRLCGYFVIVTSEDMKASEGMTFLIFDDIVNSVDDDHRGGVARLLITHPDFAAVQMILTCHLRSRC